MKNLPTNLRLGARYALDLARLHARKNILADLCLGARYALDLAGLYARLPNNQLVYYNLFFSVAIAANPSVILELGTGPGLSSLAFIRALRYYRRLGVKQGVLHSCDINPKMIRRLKKFGSLVMAHLVRTDELAVRWAEQRTPIDLLYIDADHSHEQSLADFEHFSTWVVPNGLILMHDTFPLTEQHEQLKYSGEVWKTAQYIKAHYQRDFEIMTLPYLCGISLLRKKGAKYF